MRPSNPSTTNEPVATKRREYAIPEPQWLRSLEVEVLTDARARSRAADDFGHIVHHEPQAVLRPRTSADVSRVLARASAENIGIAMRGGAHTVFGQTQVNGGVVLDVSALRRLHDANDDSIIVDAGMRWLDVVMHTYGRRRRPPILPDHLDHSVGGWLAAGGLAGEAHRHGLAADNVLELEVITRSGKRIICSRSRDSEVFDRALGGFGRRFIISRAKLRLVPWCSTVRIYTVSCADAGVLLDMQMELARDSRLDFIRGAIRGAPEERWSYTLECAIFFDGLSPPGHDRLFDRVGDGVLNVDVHDRCFKSWLFRMDATVEYLKSAKLWRVPHPRLDLILPSTTAGVCLHEMLRELEPDETAGIPISVIAVPPERTSIRLFQIRGAPISYAISVPLFTRPGTVPLSSMLERNGMLFKYARGYGGKHQGTGAIPSGSLELRESLIGTDTISQRAAVTDPNRVVTAGA